MNNEPAPNHDGTEPDNGDFTVYAAGYSPLPGELPGLGGIEFSFPEPVTDRSAAFTWFQGAAQRHKDLLDSYLELLHARDGDTTDELVITASAALQHSITELMIGHARYAGAGFPAPAEPETEYDGSFADAGYPGADEEWDPNAVDEDYPDGSSGPARSGEAELPVCIALNTIVHEDAEHVLRLRSIDVYGDGFMVHLDEALRRGGNQARGNWEALRMDHYVAGPGEFTATRADGTGLDVAFGEGESSENDRALVSESAYWITGELDDSPITLHLARADLGPEGVSVTVDGAALLAARAGVRGFG